MLTVAYSEGGQATQITFVWVLVESSSGPCWDVWVGQAVLLLTSASFAIIALCCHPLLLQSEPSTSALSLAYMEASAWVVFQNCQHMLCILPAMDCDTCMQCLTDAWSHKLR